jgi:hypothetical protein
VNRSTCCELLTFGLFILVAAVVIGISASS